MIAHLSYVMCDHCGNAAQPVAEGAKEARREALADGFIRLNGRDLCRGCTPDVCLVHGEIPTGLQCCDRCTASPVPATGR